MKSKTHFKNYNICDRKGTNFPNKQELLRVRFKKPNSAREKKNNKNWNVGQKAGEWVSLESN